MGCVKIAEILYLNIAPSEQPSIDNNKKKMAKM